MSQLNLPERPWIMDRFVGAMVKDVKCPECGDISADVLWRDCECYCEDCGDHAGLECPKCGQTFDFVWDSEKFKDQRREDAKRNT